MKTDKPSITAIIIAKNEAEMIANCIETVRWCDAILVIDNGSQDETAQLAENLGCRVIKFETESFSELRNKALGYVKTDWIFYLDADERVIPALSQEILVHAETNSGTAFQMNRKNILYGYEFNYGGWQKDMVTRVFKTNAFVGWTGKVHESPQYKGELVVLHNSLLHLTHRNTALNLQKSAEWTPIEAELLAQTITKPITLITIIRKGVMEVVRRAIFKQGYKDGLVGWIEALVQGMNRALVYIQVWEKQQLPSISSRYTQKEIEIAKDWKDFSSQQKNQQETV